MDVKILQIVDEELFPTAPIILAGFNQFKLVHPLISST